MFADMTDEELTAEISALRSAILGIAKGEGVKVVQAEGRRAEYTQANVGEARKLLRAAQAEQRRRTGEGEGRAISVEIP